MHRCVAKGLLTASQHQASNCYPPERRVTASETTKIGRFETFTETFWNILKHCRLRFQKISESRFHDISWASVWSTRSSRLLASSMGDLLRKRSPRGGARDGTRWHEGNENTTEHDRTRIHRRMMTQWWHVANDDLIKINQVCMLKIPGKGWERKVVDGCCSITNSLRNAEELTSTFSAASFAQKAPVWPAWDGLMA